MGDRLTKEREAEIRAYYRGEAQSSYYVPPDPGDYALADVLDLLAELDALRAGPDAAELETLRARVRMLEAERAEAVRLGLIPNHRLTKEREAEIRAEDYGPRDCGCPPDYARDGLASDAVADLLAELDALRAAPPTTYLHADGTEEPIGELVARLTRERDEARARVRELEAERSAWASSAGRWAGEATAQEDARHVAEAGLSVSETEIRRAASDFREIRPSGDGDLDAAVCRAQAEGRVLDFPALVRLCMDPQVDTLIYAITEAGAVFLFSEACVRKEVAEIRRAAQVEVLRDAVDTACDAVLAAVPCCNGTAAVHAVRRSLEKRADDLEAGR